MRKIILILFLFSQLFALEWIYSPRSIIFAGTIQGQKIFLTPQKIYVFSGKYYRPVFEFPEKINAVQREGDILVTDKYRIDFTQGIQLSVSENKNIQPTFVKGVFLSAHEINHIYVREKLAGDSVIIFRHDNIHYLARDNNTEQIREASPITLSFTTEDETPQFSFIYKGQKYNYSRNGNHWNRNETEQYFPEGLERMSVAELELLRATIEARKGRIFTNKRIQNYLQEQDWYNPDAQYTSERLTKQDLKNIELIYSFENAKIREGLYE